MQYTTRTLPMMSPYNCRPSLQLTQPTPFSQMPTQSQSLHASPPVQLVPRKQMKEIIAKGIDAGLKNAAQQVLAVSQKGFDASFELTKEILEANGLKSSDGGEENACDFKSEFEKMSAAQAKRKRLLKDTFECLTRITTEHLGKIKVANKIAKSAVEEAFRGENYNRAAERVTHGLRIKVDVLNVRIQNRIRAQKRAPSLDAFTWRIATQIRLAKRPKSRQSYSD